nr:ribonuclease H-like domain-containing protein [Tanacetum cinerariifolium]
MSDHEDETINKENVPPKVVLQITTVTNISTKFPYLKKEEYDIWAMKMQNFISSSDLLCWNIVLKGNSAKSMTIDNDGNLKIHPPITTEEHQQVQREEKARTILLSALPDEHMGDFYHMIDARDIWNAIKARFEEGLDKGCDKMQKILSQMNTLKIKPKPEDVNMKFLRGLPPSWSGIDLILKTKGGLEYISFDDLYNKLKFLEIDIKRYLSSSFTLSNAAFGSSKSNCSVVDDVIYFFFANHEIDQHLVYKDLDQMNKEDFEEYNLKHQMAMLSIKVHRFKKNHGRKIKFNGRENARFDKKLVKCFNCKQMGHFSRECRAQGGQNSNNYKKYKSKEAGKDRSDSKAMVVVDGSIDWDKQTEEGNTEPRSLENFSMVAGLEIASDADLEGEVVSADDAIPAGVSVSAGDVAAVVGQPIYNMFASVDHMKVVPPPLTGNYMPPSNIPDIDESQMMYGKKATDSSEIKTNDDSISHSHNSVLFDFSDSVSAHASESRDTIVIDCARQEDFPSVCTSSIETYVKSSNTFYLHLIKDCDLQEQRLVKRNTEGKGKLGRRPTGKPVNLNRPKPVSACQPNPVSADLLKVCRALTMSARVLNCLDFKLKEMVMAMMTCLKLSGVHYQCFTVKCGLIWWFQNQAERIQRCSWCFKFHIHNQYVAVSTSCCFTLNPHTAHMTIYYWKLDNKQVIIQFGGGLLGIVIPAARAFCFCCQVFISAGVLFLLLEYSIPAVSSSLLLLASITAVKQIVIVS